MNLAFIASMALLAHILWSIAFSISSTPSETYTYLSRLCSSWHSLEEGTSQ